jgi:hypothetical protein
MRQHAVPVVRRMGRLSARSLKGLPLGVDGDTRTGTKRGDHLVIPTEHSDEGPQNFQVGGAFEIPLYARDDRRA